MNQQQQAALAQETLALMKQAQATPSSDLAKAFTQSGSATTGITAYDLEAPSKKLYPVITPLRNRIPRVSGRGGVVATSTADYNAVYRGLGLEDYVTLEAEYASQGYEDVKALAVEGLLRSLMIQEERIVLGGNGGAVALGTTPTPSASAATSGGGLADATWRVICVALTLEGYLNSSVSATGVPGRISRTNSDSSTDAFGGGSAKQSAAATATVTGGGGAGSVSASVAAVNGAFAYAWYLGSSAGTERLHSITTINSIKFVAAAGGSNQLASDLATAQTGAGGSDQSQNALVFDGLLYQICKSGSNSYIKTMATGTAGTGTPLTADTYGGIVEIDDALKYFWDTWRLSPTDIYVSSQELQNITKKVLQGGANAAQRFNFTVNQDMIGGGVMVTSYLNKFGMMGPTEIPFRLHPNLPPGTIMFYCDKPPYPISNIQNVVQIKTRREYYQIEWPMRTRKYEYGVYADEVLQNYFPPSFGIITNIANG